MAKKSAEVAAIERLAVQQEMTNRLLALFMTRMYEPVFPPTLVAKSLSETSATPAEIARVVPGTHARSIATLKWSNKPRQEDAALVTAPDGAEPPAL